MRDAKASECGETGKDFLPYWLFKIRHETAISFIIY